MPKLLYTIPNNKILDTKFSTIGIIFDGGPSIDNDIKMFEIIVSSITTQNIKIKLHHGMPIDKYPDLNFANCSYSIYYDEISIDL